ncbi:Transcription factor spt8 [Coniosporium tulheliwenetii]|uniref:Transcription factor spt8 n=1 Tax=Coniosporium tulheliwenetii TaxID=3383036 RepID=A0ACC2ZDB9_9PEZI|nr:Transcription factor spt8 [Cladosporium sp. JES 115]
MVSFEDEDENGAGSPDSSENDPDEAMEDVDDADADGDADADADGDMDAEGDNDEDEGDNEDDEEQDDTPESPSRTQRPNRPPTSVRTPVANGVSSLRQGSVDGVDGFRADPSVRFASASPRASSVSQRASLPFRPRVRPEALVASTYDIAPTIAAPHSTSINAVAATPDMRWVFTGGSDGYIRKFNWVDTVNGKLMLTVAQKHPFVDSVTKAGSLVSYWENENAPGTINLQSVRHDEGKRITCLRKHTSAVSVLNLARDETSVLSGSWDKAIIDWDLNTGDIKRVFESGTGGQISAIEPRPYSSLPVPDDSAFVPLSNRTFSSNNDAKPLPNGIVMNGVRNTAGGSGATANGIEDAAGSPHNSLFEDNDSHGSLFGDEEGGAGGDSAIPQLGGDEDNEFSRAIADSIQQQQEADTEADAEMTDIGGPVQAPAPVPEQDSTITAPTESAQLESLMNGVADAQGQPAPTTNGLTHSAQSTTAAGTSHSAAGPDGADTPLTSDTTFLDASIDGTLRVWDRRQPNPVARIFPSKSIPPWCMGACWSPDGNFIYAGRRNGAVDEYSLHRGLREPTRTLRFPSVSGPVTAVRAMPNGRHLVW